MPTEVRTPRRQDTAATPHKQLRKVARGLADRPLATACLITAALYVVVLGFMTPAYDTNDDRAMLGIVSGTTYGAPSEHITFMNVAIGLVLKHAYQLTDRVPWFALLLYGLQFVAIVGLIWGLLRTGRRHLGVLAPAIAALAVVFFVPMTLRIQFTSVAILLGAAGIVVHAAALVRRVPSLAVHVAAGAMLGSAVLVRQSGFRGALLLGLPLLAWQLARSRDVLVRYAVFGGACLVIVASGTLFERAYYDSRPEWREYSTFNSVRGSLHATPRLLPSPELHEAAAQVGWSSNDLDLFRVWYFSDANRYSTEALRTIRDATDGGRGSLPDVRQTASNLRSMFAAPTLAALASGALAIGLAGGRARWWPAAMLAVGFGAITYLDSFVRLPSRVALPLLLFIAIGCLLIGVASRSNRQPSAASIDEHPHRDRVPVIVTRGALVLLVLTAAWTIPTVIDDSRVHAARARESDVTLDRLHQFATTRDAVIVSWGGRLDTGFRTPFETATRQLRDFERITLGWPQRSPDWNANLERLDIEDPLEAVLTDDRVFVAAQEFHLELLTTFARERHGLTVEYERMLEGPGVHPFGDVYAAHTTPDPAQP